MNASPNSKPSSEDLSPLAWWLRETISILVWSYAAIKLFVYDFDIHLVSEFAPEFRWVLDYKAFVLLTVVSLSWLLIRRSMFHRIAGYIACYPLLIAFWRLPLWLMARWPLVIIFAPAIHRGITSIRSSVVLYTVGALSALASLKATGPMLLVSLVGLAAFLTTHLRRALRKAYSSSVFVTLSSYLRQLRASIETGSFDPNRDTSKLTEEQKAAAAKQDPILGFYLFRVAAEVVAEKVALVGRGRKYDFYLLCSLFYTTAITATTFSFAYVAVYRSDPASFAVPTGHGFWSFFGYSLGLLTSSSISKVEPLGSLAQFISHLEIACCYLLLVMLVFTVLTAARCEFSLGCSPGVTPEMFVVPKPKQPGGPR